MIKILIIEDEEVLSDNIREILEDLGEITQVYDGESGLYEASLGVYDIILLDLMLPEKHGYQVLAELRQENVQTPVLILTAKDSLEDKVVGFQKGADDYLTKPFYREELLLRVKALLRRSLGLFSEQQISSSGLICQLTTRQVQYAGQVLPIQGKEFELLVYFMQNKGIILTKEQIFDRIWGFDSNTTLQVVEVYMSHLRKHLKEVKKEHLIQTLRNVGYIFQEEG
ncbi:response regulator transcription factor [Enterococcus lemanii]|jgi:two-component system response regulator CiaR|uniref:Response regulator transcription factor n=1 Tax=Enterococcus lemanii TaxID=1159752 RepID=A0ABV9MS44_9ENTE|nr:response regulator transcription factor [Enterococcus lemanii]MBM7708873.1 two-component system response regulator CiaR [Enterococcus lemanii]